MPDPAAPALAALLHDDPDLCATPSGIMVHSDRGYCDRIAARLTARGVTVGLDVEWLGRVMREFYGPCCCDEAYSGRHLIDPQCWQHDVEEDAEYLARAYAATPQPAEEGPCVRCGYLRDSGTHDTAETCDEVRGPCLDPQRHHPYQPAQPAPDALREAAHIVEQQGLALGRLLAAAQAYLDAEEALDTWDVAHHFVINSERDRLDGMKAEAREAMRAAIEEADRG